MNELEQTIDIFPQDSIRKKRIANIRKAKKILTRKAGNEICGVVFVNNRFLVLPNITWITREKYRNRGIATELVREAQKHYRLLTAKTRDDASARVAEKSGFKHLFDSYWLWIRW